MENKAPIHVLVTGAAGFIGFHVCERLIREGYRVSGLDLAGQEPGSLHRDRLAVLGIGGELPENTPQTSRFHPGFTFFRTDVRDREGLEQVFAGGITHVIHLAAAVGVRRSVEEPLPYLQTNVEGFFNVLEASRRHRVRHLVFASSSSVYGLTEESPFRVEQPTDHPASFYAATKKSNELFAHSYAHLHGLPVTGLRFFTVYGPWGRPDMALYLFTRNIVTGKPIRVFNHGHLRRDFTYVGDIVEGIARIFPHPPAPLTAGTSPQPGRSHSAYRLYNIGLGAPVEIMDFIRELEQLIGRKAVIELADHQPGDIGETFADVDGLRRDFGYRPTTDLKTGLKAYWEWYENYYNGQ